MKNIRSDEEIYGKAIQIQSDQAQAEYVRQVCLGDNALRDRVMGLIRVSKEQSSFLERPAVALVATVDQPPSQERPGSQIGPYKLMEQIGEGGFGLVFVAEQQQPVRRKVALKVIKPGMDSREVIARFEAERQALALMDHPNIAKIHDAGTTPSGRPFFVMELVRGVPISEYCDACKLSPAGRLDLFTHVCQAVQHAHQKGVIHRDLKPSNILVAPHDGVPVVKVIDFGVAKALGQQLTDKTIYTRFAQMIGTPLYMSPEQAEINALDVDTRSDVYSLGVLLYELLTGTTPFDKKRLASAAFDEIRRIIREEEPVRPSTRLSTLGESLSIISSQRGLEPVKLGQLLRGDLDVIVMKALEKDRNRRYDTATALADDVGRFLAQEPILARTASTVYRLKKFVVRNKLTVSVGAAIAAMIFAGLSFSIWSAARTRQAYQVAQRERLHAEEQRAIAEQERDNATEQRNQVSVLNATLSEQQEKQRRMLYTSDMNLVQVAAEAHDAARMRTLLEKHRPSPGQTDLCGFEWHYWNRKLHGEVASIKLKNWQLRLRNPIARQDLGRIQTPEYGGIRFIDGGSHVVHLSPMEQIAMMWDVATGNSINRSFPTIRSSMQGGRSYVVAGTRFAIGEGFSFNNRNWSAGPRELAVYELDRDDPLMSVSFLDKYVMIPQLSRDGRFVAATETITDNQTPAAEHRTLKIWEVDSGREVFKLPIDRNSAKVTFHPSEPKIVVTLTESGPDPKAVAKVFDLNDASELAQIPVSAGESVFNRDGSLFAVFVSNRNRSDIQLQMYDANANYAHLWTIPLSIASITPVFSDDGDWVAVTSGPGIRVFGARDGQERSALLGHSASIVSLGFCEPNGDLLSIDSSGIVKRWQVDSNPGRNTVKYNLDDSLKAISIDGARFATAKIEPPSSVTVLDKSGKVLWESPAIDGKIQSLSCGMDGRRVAALATTADGAPQPTATVYVWDIDSRREQLRSQCAGKQDSMYKPIVRIDPTGDLIAVRYPMVDSSLQIIDISSGQPKQTLNIENTDEIMWSPCGRWLVSAGLNISQQESVAPVPVRIWDATTGLMKWDSNTPCRTIAFSADGDWACAVQDDVVSQFLNVLSLETGEEIQRLRIPEGTQKADGRFAIAMSNDGQYIAIAKYGSSLPSSSIRVWSRFFPDRPKWSIQLPSSVGNLKIMLDFNKDGSRLAAAFDDRRMGNIRLWSTESGDELLRLPIAATWLAFDKNATALRLRRDLGNTCQTFELDAAPIPADVEGPR